MEKNIFNEIKFFNGVTAEVLYGRTNYGLEYRNVEVKGVDFDNCTIKDAEGRVYTLDEIENIFSW